MAIGTWRRRWERAVEDLTAARAENLQLRQALDELNQETEGVFSVAGQGGIEAAKSWLIKQQRKVIRGHRSKIGTPVKFAPSSPEDHGLIFLGSTN